MKFEGHYILTVFLALVIAFLFGYKLGILIGLAHFIPSIDWIMKRLDIFYHHHRSLVHNIFVIPLSYILFYLLTKDFVIPIYCALSTASHLLLDYIDMEGRGLALFFPFSKKRYKWPLLSEDVENIMINLAMVMTIILSVIIIIR
jgi:hypothetical protein